MITKATSPGYLYAVTTDSTCIITDVDTRYNLCKAVVNKQGMFVAIGGSVECSDDNVLLTQASTTSGGTRFEVATARPAVGETGVIYLVPASNSTTENLYEEWVWVDDKWEQIGSAGLNLSNYAQLTTSNTFSAANTFNGNLIKKTSGSLADNSVLNRSEMDSRYGRLVESNNWRQTNEFAGIKTTGMISLNSNNTAYIKGSSNSMTLKAANINLHGYVTVSNNKSVRVDRIETDNISGINSLKLQADNSSIDIADNKVSIYGNTGIHLNSSGDILLNADESLRLTGIASLSLGCRGVSMWLDAANEGSISLRAYTDATISMSHKNKNITLDATTIDLDARTVNMADNGMLKFSDRSHITENVISGIPVLDNDARKIHLGSQSNTVPGTNKYCVDITPGLYSPYVYSPYINTAHAAVDTISGIKTLNTGDLRINANVSIVGDLGLKGTLTAGSEKSTIDVRANLHMQGKDIKHVYNISSPNGVSLGIKSNIHAYGNSIYEADEVRLGKLKASSLSAIPGRIDVLSSLHFPSAAGSYVDPDIVIANEELRAVNLSTILGKEDKYGIRITNTSCQLFGIDFNYGDVWSETNDRIKAQGATPMPGLDSASYLDTVKIRKPAVSIETTGIGSLSFDYANEAYIRTFPNDGGQGIFEFQAGNWTDSNANWIKRGPVDLRKASATTLGPTSVLNMEEGDARWGGGGGGLQDVLVVSKVPDGTTPLQQPQFASNSAYDSDISFGIAIGPGNTANLYRDIVIGCCLDADPGQGHNTLLGYGFRLSPGATGAVAIGHSDSLHALHSSTIVIGNRRIAKGLGAIAIGGDVTGTSGISLRGSAGEGAITIGGVASNNAIAIGYPSTAGKYGTALGWYSCASHGELTLQAGNAPIVTMQLYGGTDWESKNETGYLRLSVTKSSDYVSSTTSENKDSITIHKKPLWDAIQRAKDYNYPAQPFVSLVGDNGEVPSALANAQPNTIYHIVVGAMDIDLADMMFDPSIPGIASAELHFEVPSGTTPFVAWPDIMLWPDEADPTVAPTLSGAASGNKLYAIVVRKQITRAGEFLVASVAYSFEY